MRNIHKDKSLRLSYLTTLLGLLQSSRVNRHGESNNLEMIVKANHSRVVCIANFWLFIKGLQLFVTQFISHDLSMVNKNYSIGKYFKQQGLLKDIVLRKWSISNLF